MDATHKLDVLCFDGALPHEKKNKAAGQEGHAKCQVKTQSEACRIFAKTLIVDLGGKGGMRKVRSKIIILCEETVCRIALKLFHHNSNKEETWNLCNPCSLAHVIRNCSAGLCCCLGKVFN